MSVLGIFTFSFAAGALLYVLCLPSWASAVLFVLALFFGIIALFFRKGKRPILPLVAFGMALGLLWTGIYEFRQLRPLEALTQEETYIRLTALEDEEQTDYGSKVLCRSGSVRILVYVFDCEEEIYAGNEILIEGILEAESPEGGLSYIAKDIDMTLRQKGNITVTEGEQNLRSLPARVYGSVQRRIMKLFPEDTAPFALALLTGNTGLLSYRFRNEMSLAGISHVVAVSGMHVSLICSLVLNLCLRRRQLAAGLCLGAMWFFGAMLGFSPSVTRAVVMNSVLLMAPVLKREYDGPTALGFSLFLLLLKNPFSVASPGLQLSFASVAGILLLTESMTQKLREAYPRKRRKKGLLWKLYAFLTASLSTSVGACFLTVPLVAYYFGTVSLVAFVSNLILLPVITLIFSLGYPVVLLSYFAYPVAETVAEYMSVPIRGILMGIHLLSRIPYGALYSRSMYVILWLVATYGAVALGIRYKRQGTAILLSIALLITVPGFQRIRPEDFRFTMLDVGQGQCILAELGESVLVIDCGGTYEEDTGEEASRELLSRGISSVQGLILTHYDLDHCGGVLQLMDRIAVRCLYLPDIRPEDDLRQRIVQRATELDVPIIWIKEDIHLQTDRGSVDIFAPVTTKTENDGLSLLLSARDYDILITGDLSIEGERKLIRSVALPDLEILVAGHHGASNSSGEELLEHTMPETLLISVGLNSYGHPDSQVLERAERLGILVRRTDQEGTITITR